MWRKSIFTAIASFWYSLNRETERNFPDDLFLMTSFSLLCPWVTVALIKLLPDRPLSGDWYISGWDGCTGTVLRASADPGSWGERWESEAGAWVSGRLIWGDSPDPEMEAAAESNASSAASSRSLSSKEQEGIFGEAISWSLEINEVYFFCWVEINAVLVSQAKRFSQDGDCLCLHDVQYIVQLLTVEVFLTKNSISLVRRKKISYFLLKENLKFNFE